MHEKKHHVKRNKKYNKILNFLNFGAHFHTCYSDPKNAQKPPVFTARVAGRSVGRLAGGGRERCARRIGAHSAGEIERIRSTESSTLQVIRLVCSINQHFIWQQPRLLWWWWWWWYCLRAFISINKTRCSDRSRLCVSDCCRFPVILAPQALRAAAERKEAALRRAEAEKQALAELKATELARLRAEAAKVSVVL